MEFSEEQKKVIYLRNKNILVSAAAGAGKTSVLVERIIKRVLSDEDPVDIDRILTVTFTNAAAAEMKGRIRKRLNDEAKTDKGNMRIIKQLNLVHNASIMTIDAFCVKVLRENFEELDIDPSFRVGDENEIELIREDSCDEILDEAYEEGREEFLKFLGMCSPGREDRDVAESIMKLSKASDARPDPELWLRSLEGPYLENDPEKAFFALAIVEISTDILKAVKKSYDALISISTGAGGPYMYEDLLRNEREMVSDILERTTYTERYEALRTLDFGKLSSKKDEEVDPDLRNMVKNLRTREKGRLQKLRDELFPGDADKAMSDMEKAAPAVSELINLTLRYRERFFEKKKEHSVLDFSDIEHMALKILKGEAGDSYREFYREVMTDEYQDSNGIQEALLSLVAGKDNYFCVGDVKQSIYSFRLAEPEIFMKRYRDYEDDPLSERILLNRNYRSRNSVIDAVNAVFKIIMHKENGGVEYGEDQKLFFGEGYDEDREINKTEVCLIEDKGDNDAEAIELEAAFIASRIGEMVGSFDVTKYVDGEFIKRKAGYADFAILLRSASGNDEKVRDILISRGIPAVTEARSGYFKTREVRDIINYLSIIDNPRQDIALIAALKSPFGGFKDSDLSLIRASYKEGLFLDALFKGDYDEDLKKRTFAFMDKVNGYRDVLPYTPINELISMILDDEYTVQSSGSGAKENLKLLVKRAADFEKTSFRGLFSFLRYIEKMKKYDMDMGEAAKNEGTEAVRIMSIHKSKGLEFPVVFVSNIEKQFNMTDARGDLIWHRDMGLGISYTDQETKIKHKSPLKRAVALKMKLDTIGEEMRILYVGLTRAREKLIMTGVTKDREKFFEKSVPVTDSASYLDLIRAAFQEDSNGDVRNSIVFSVMDPETMTGERLKEQLSFEDRKKNIRASEDASETEEIRAIRDELLWRYPHLSAVTTLSKVSVTELKRREMNAEEESILVPDITDSMSEESPEEKLQKKKLEKAGKKKGADAGNAFHKAMTLVPAGIKGDSDSVKAFISGVIDEGSMEKAEADLLDPGKIGEFLNSPLWERMDAALKRGELFREQPFIMGKRASEVFPEGPEDETVQIQGIIDAFFIEDNGITVIDYKTDKVKEGGTLVKRYRKQLELYAEALSKLLRLPVREKLIYSVHLSKVIDVK